MVNANPIKNIDQAQEPESNTKNKILFCNTNIFSTSSNVFKSKEQPKEQQNELSYEEKKKLFQTKRKQRKSASVISTPAGSSPKYSAENLLQETRKTLNNHPQPKHNLNGIEEEEI